MDSFRRILQEIGLNYKKNKIKKLWGQLPKDEKTLISSGDFSNAKNAISILLIGEAWSETPEFKEKWAYVINPWKELDDYCKELESLL